MIVAPRAAVTGAWPRAVGWMPVTQESVARIAGLGDPSLRNLWITQSYADLGRRLLAIYGSDQTWCSFATWWSNSAGIAIRSHELPHVVETLLLGGGRHVDAVVDAVNDHTALADRFLERFEWFHLERVVVTALRRAAEHLAHGNAAVYAELAPPLVRLVVALERPDVPRDVDALLESIVEPGDAPLVDQVLRNYVAAAVTDDPVARAQHVLLANLAATLREQEVLQESLAATLDAGLVDVREELELLYQRPVSTRLRRRLLSRVSTRATPHVEALWDHITTELVLQLALPGETLYLGADVPPLPGGEQFPEPLERLHLSDLVALVEAWDPTDGTGLGSATAEWSDLHERMGYLVNLVRSRQRSLVLTTPPFTQAHLDVMVRGRVPVSL